MHVKYPVEGGILGGEALRPGTEIEKKVTQVDGGRENG
jgi:hypothetical protein